MDTGSWQPAHGTSTGGRWRAGAHAGKPVCNSRPTLGMRDTSRLGVRHLGPARPGHRGAGPHVSGCRHGRRSVASDHALRGHRALAMGSGSSDRRTAAVAPHHRVRTVGGLQRPYERVVLPAGLRRQRGRLLPLSRHRRGLPRRRAFAVHRSDAPASPGPGQRGRRARPEPAGSRSRRHASAPVPRDARRRRAAGGRRADAGACGHACRPLRTHGVRAADRVRAVRRAHAVLPTPALVGRPLAIRHRR
jgi:hypothetical protein